MVFAIKRGLKGQPQQWLKGIKYFEALVPNHNPDPFRDEDERAAKARADRHKKTQERGKAKKKPAGRKPVRKTVGVKRKVAKVKTPRRKAPAKSKAKAAKTRKGN